MQKGRGGVYLPERGQQGKMDRTRPVFALLGIGAVIGWAYVLFVSELFSVNQVVAQGLVTLDPVDVSREVFRVMDERTSWRPWSTRHGWFIDKEKISEELKSRLFAERVTVDNISPHVLRLSVEERSSKFIFQSHQQYYWADIHGTAVKELSLDERKIAQSRLLGSRAPLPNDPPIIHRDLADFISAGYKIAEPADVKAWIQDTSEIVRAGLLYRDFEPPMVSSTLGIVISPEGYRVYVDTGDPLNPQIKTYLAFKKALTKDLVVNEYVDVRVPGKVFVK